MVKKRTSLIRSPDFKTIYAVGAIGTWTPYDFRINFYSEKVSEEEEESYINDTQVILTPKATKEFAYWLMQNINEYEAIYGKSEPEIKSESQTEVKVDNEFKGNLRDGLKEDIKHEIINDLRKYMKQSLENDLKKELKMVPSPEFQKNLKKVIKDDLEQDLRKDIKPELRKDLKRVLRADLKQDLREDLKKDIREELKRDLRTSLPNQPQKLKPKAKTKRTIPSQGKNSQQKKQK